LIAFTFFIFLPLIHEIVAFFTSLTSLTCESETRTVGLENVKLYAAKVSHPFFSFTCVVAVLGSPFSDVIETVALTGAEVNP
jgi:hypothetical protein